MLSEECELPLFHVDALASLVEVFLVQFKSDKVAFLLDTSDGGCAAAHAVVEHGVALVCVGQDKLAEQVNGLLRGVNTIITVPGL